MLKRIEAIHELGEELMFAHCKEVGLMAMNIADVAAVADMKDIGEAASGIRIMIDSLVEKGVWHTDGLELHITSLVLLASEPPPSSDEAAQVLARLGGMRKAIGVLE